MLLIEHVSVRFGTRQVLDDVSALFDGGTNAIVGPSGSGKSTLLGIVANQISADDGTITIEPRVPVHWIVQSAPILARRTVIANVMLGPLSRALSPDDARARAQTALHDLGLGVLENRRSFELSGGERQRVAVARVLASGGGVVLADEPTASLDAHARNLVCDALVAVGDQGSVVLIATHDAYVRDRCDRAYQLSDGRLGAA